MPGKPNSRRRASTLLDSDKKFRGQTNGHLRRNPRDKRETHVLPRNNIPSNLPLPTELRLEIFGYALTNPDDRPLHIQRYPVEYILPIPWMSATREIFAETLPILFKNNEFAIKIYPPSIKESDLHPSGSPAIFFGRKTLRLLRARNLMQAPLFRDVSFSFSYSTTSTYGAKAGADIFRLRCIRGRARISHHECVFCGTCDWLCGERCKDPDVSHPSCTSVLEGKYLQALDEHGRQLGLLNEQVAELKVHPAGLTYGNIGSVMAVLYRGFKQGKCKRLPNRKLGRWVYRDPTKLSQHLYNCNLSNKVIADMYHRRREWDREHERARVAAIDAVRDARRKRLSANEVFPYLVITAFGVLGAVGCFLLAGLKAFFLWSMQDMMPYLVCVGQVPLVMSGALLYKGLNDLFLWYYGKEV